MNLLADQHIPLIQDYFSKDFSISTFCSSPPASKLKDADVLLVRSVTTIDAELLQHANLAFIGTATSGYDHIDTDYLAQHRTPWAHAPGCNARSVAEYVVCTLAELLASNTLASPPLRAAVIGVGEVGKRVALALRILGCEIVYCDPLRADSEPDFTHTPINEIYDVDIVSVHTPLTQTGKYPSYHLLNKTFLARQRDKTVIINTARGNVLDPSALLHEQSRLIFCVDVFPDEPAINPALVNACALATPHIAGHAIQAKWRGTQMLYKSIANYFDLPSKIEPVKMPVKPPLARIASANTWQDVVLQLYPIIDDHNALKRLRNNPTIAAAFSDYRNNYPIRHEFTYPTHTLPNTLSSEEKHRVSALLKIDRI